MCVILSGLGGVAVIRASPSPPSLLSASCALAAPPASALQLLAPSGYKCMLPHWQSLNPGVFGGAVRRSLSSSSAAYAIPAAASTTVSLSIASSSPLLPLRLQEQRRHRSFHFYLNLSDPAETRRRVEEDLSRIDQEQMRGKMAHLHALLNLALSYYQSGEYITAREYAEYVHEKTLQYNRNATLLFFTAKTCAHCSLAVADEYEAHLKEMAESADISSTLTPSPSVVFSAKRTITKLREDAARYDGIARRFRNRPDKAFMHADMATGGWSEDTCGTDEDPQEPFNEQWKDRRKRPEHAAIRQFYQKQSRGSCVPK